MDDILRRSIETHMSGADRYVLDEYVSVLKRFRDKSPVICNLFIPDIEDIIKIAEKHKQLKFLQREIESEQESINSYRVSIKDRQNIIKTLLKQMQDTIVE